MPTPPVINGLLGAVIVGSGVAICYIFMARGLAGRWTSVLPALVLGVLAFLVALWLFQ